VETLHLSPWVQKYKVLLHKLDSKSTHLKTYKGAETDSRAKFGKEIIARAHREAKMGPIL